MTSITQDPKGQVRSKGAACLENILILMHSFFAVWVVGSIAIIDLASCVDPMTPACFDVRILLCEHPPPAQIHRHLHEDCPFALTRCCEGDGTRLYSVGRRRHKDDSNRCKVTLPLTKHKEKV